MIRRLLIVLAAMLPLLGVVPPASASSAYVALHNQGDSGAHLDVYMVNNVTGRGYEINLYPGSTAGEPRYLYSDSEPVSWYHRAGWCEKFLLDGETEPSYLYAQSYGYWWNVHDWASGQHIEYVKTWNC